MDMSKPQLHPLPIDAVLAAVDGHITGLSESEAAVRLNRQEPNLLPEDRRKLARNRVRKFVNFAEEWKNVRLSREFLAAIRSQGVDTQEILGTTT